MREALANAIHSIFWIGPALMVMALAALLFVPEVPLRRAVREDAAHPDREEARSLAPPVEEGPVGPARPRPDTGSTIASRPS